MAEIEVRYEGAERVDGEWECGFQSVHGRRFELVNGAEQEVLGLGYFGDDFEAFLHEGLVLKVEDAWEVGQAEWSYAWDVVHRHFCSFCCANLRRQGRRIKPKFYSM